MVPAIETKRARSFSVLAYFAALVVGCLAVGISWPLFWAVLVAGHLEAYSISAMIFSLPLGIIPGAILGLPGLFLSIKMRNYLHLEKMRWYVLLGCLNGILVLFTMSAAWQIFVVYLVKEAVSEIPPILELFPLVLAFALGGAVAGYFYRNTEQLTATGW